MSSATQLDRARDLDSPEEIAEMVRRFYQDVAQDDLLGPMFNDVAQVDWAEHLPKLAAFWCRALLGMPGYQGNPFRAHALVHAQVPFTPEHFQRWLELFTETIEGGWQGPGRDRALALAYNVARVHSNQLLGAPVDTSGIEPSTAASEPVAATIGPSSSAGTNR
jgi:hemoglobin